MNKAILIIAILFAGQLLAQQDSKERINDIIDNWHKAASEADFETYFGILSDDGVFIGTDASENWQNEEFRTFSKPYFDRGKAWSFTAIERNIYLDESKTLAWFDELLDTRMKICRGSGVLQKQDGTWRIKHYVLSIAIPNDNVEQVIELKKEKDSLFMLEKSSGNIKDY
ncbi:nuclear transport factor 2 family protein [uncultured Eudoraea sp.]|uniref:nuclear transport factor 2 family protein n=1 Tax=uncultured Eudoraea sp. TaxID=1035614 RepID=UPI0026262074|nr:nuclear transport factor 2 family protein [uncultured Eudoraea sp.]